MGRKKEPPLAPGVPGVIADLFVTHEIKWTPGWGDYKKKTCLHGALLRPCAIPGDEIAQPWIGSPSSWTQEAHDRLMAPWVSVFGALGDG